MDRDKPLNPARFWFRCSLIHAVGSSADRGLHSNTLRLQLQFNAFDTVIRRLVARLPLKIQDWISCIFPKWTLPPTVILKATKPDAYPGDFDNEIAMYQRLKPIQGTTVPVFYGEARFRGERAIILSDIGGDPLYSPKIPVFTKVKFTEKLQEAIEAMQAQGVEHGDISLPNYHLVDEWAEERKHEDIERLWDHLQKTQDCQRYDGIR